MSAPVSHDHSLAREATLKILYQIDLHKISDFETIQNLIEKTILELEIGAGSSQTAVEKYTRRLTHGVMSHREEIDGVIRSVAKNWDLKRMAIIDRNVIRMGAFEILRNPQVPRAVAINEAIELVKRYSTVESGTFVNGLLDQMHPEPLD